MDQIVLLIIGVLLAGGILFLCATRRKKLSAENAQHFGEKIQATEKLDPAHSVIESHKLFIAALGTLFSDAKKVNAAKLIQRVAKRLPNKEKIWESHRLRNRIAHEEHGQISFAQAEKIRGEFLRALEALKNK